MLYPPSEPSDPSKLRQIDKDLNIAYQRCIHALPTAEVTNLRQAQRAWIVFRDASRKLGDEVVFKITFDRTWFLHHYYIVAATPEISPSKPPPENTFEKSDPTTPDPFESVRSKPRNLGGQ
jgi:hypothetical protein